MAQRLANTSSLYLRQHQHQEVDWWPYSARPFAAAEEQDKPVLISIGYAACHWCHVMSHESFDDPHVAEFINEHFIAIKVDREEHPLVDDTYMLATQAMTGAGGWPMTVFTLPDGRAFHTGTYYPATPRGKMPSFTQVLSAVHEAYTQRREAVQQQAGALAAHLAQLSSGHHQLAGFTSQQATQTDALAAAETNWIQNTQPTGGFTPAPKFPPTQSLTVIWQRVLTSADPRELFEAACTTTEALLLGGLQDHLRGGFARYCVDEAWAVPHFEKMLYDNAQLLRMLTSAYAVCTEVVGQFSDPALQQRATDLASAAERATRGIVQWLDTHMLTGSAHGLPGAFAASLDADSVRGNGTAEGAYYTFSDAQRQWLLSELGQPLPQGLIRWVEVADDPGHYCLSLARMPQATEWPAWDALLDAARDLSAQRSVPQRDEKVVAGWNGLAVEALVHAAQIMNRPEYRQLAETVANYLWTQHFDGDKAQLARTSFAGQADHSNQGTLEDYAGLSLGFLALAGTDDAGVWSERAQLLLDGALNFVDTQGLARDMVELDPVLHAQRGEQPAANLLDDAIPAAGSLLARALSVRALDLLSHDDNIERAQSYLDRAASLVSHAQLLAGKFPTAAAGALEVWALHESPVQYLRPSDPQAPQLGTWRSLAGVLGLAVGSPGAEHSAHPDGSLRIYPCRDTSCQAPITEPAQLLSILRGDRPQWAT